MPEGSDEQKNFMGEPSDEAGNILATEAASPYGGEDDTAEEEQNADTQQQEQLTAEQQDEIAISFATNKQRTIQQIQREMLELQNQLGELEKNLADFRSSNLGGFLSIFRPRINLLIDTLLDQLKKSAQNLSDEAKIGYYTSLIVTITSLIGILTAFKFLAAFWDAAFIDWFSCLRLVIASFATCIIPIILVLISPLYISFLAIIFLIGKIPLLKGTLTKNIMELIKNLKSQRAAWQAELDKVKKKVTLRKQIKDLQKAEQEVRRMP